MEVDWQDEGRPGALQGLDDVIRRLGRNRRAGRQQAFEVEASGVMEGGGQVGIAGGEPLVSLWPPSEGGLTAISAQVISAIPSEVC